MSNDMAVANTILEQLGGNRFRAMTGARDFVGDDKSLQFRLPRAAKGVTRVRVALDATDTYTVSFYKGRGLDLSLLSEQEGVYADALRAVFTAATGLYTSL